MKKVLTISISSALLVSLMLFYIDEGYYDFRWMSNVGNWIAFVVYAGVITLLYTATLSLARAVSPALIPATASRAQTTMTVVVCTVVGFIGSLSFFTQLG